MTTTSNKRCLCDLFFMEDDDAIGRESGLWIGEKEREWREKERKESKHTLGEMKILLSEIEKHFLSSTLVQSVLGKNRFHAFRLQLLFEIEYLFSGKTKGSLWAEKIVSLCNSRLSFYHLHSTCHLHHFLLNNQAPHCLTGQKNEPSMRYFFVANPFSLTSIGIGRIRNGLWLMMWLEFLQDFFSPGWISTSKDLSAFFSPLEENDPQR